MNHVRKVQCSRTLSSGSTKEGIKWIWDVRKATAVDSKSTHESPFAVWCECFLIAHVLAWSLNQFSQTARALWMRHPRTEQRPWSRYGRRHLCTQTADSFESIVQYFTPLWESVCNVDSIFMSILSHKLLGVTSGSELGILSLLLEFHWESRLGLLGNPFHVYVRYYASCFSSVRYFGKIRSTWSLPAIPFLKEQYIACH